MSEAQPLPTYGPNFWDQRYGAADYVFGTEPNVFLREHAGTIMGGPVLCLAEGEGRNAVHLATLGYAVTAIDQSAVGLAKAQRLATQRGVSLTTWVGDIEDFALQPSAWGAIVSIFFHLPAEVRRQLHRRVVAGLRPGGVFLLECYTPAQLAYGTGGPKDVALLVTLAQLRDELAGLEFRFGRELERPVIEGTGRGGAGGGGAGVRSARPGAISILKMDTKKG